MLRHRSHRTAPTEQAAPVHDVKRAESPRLKLTFVLSAAFAVFGAVLFLVGLQMPQWFIGVAQGNTQTFGLGVQCNNGLCLIEEYKATSLASCFVNGNSWQHRLTAVRWTLYCGIGLALVSALLYLLAATRDPSFARSSIVTQLGSVACTAVSIVLFAATYEGWFFCGTSFCQYVRSATGTALTPCFRTYGTGAVMVASGVCLELLGVVYGVATVMVRKRRHTALKIALANRPPAADQQLVVEFEPPAGFIFDPSCGLYYSDEAQLYLDPESCHYYDPASGLWYNSETEEWYELREA